LPKRITDQQREELKHRFLSGEDIVTLAQEFKYSKLTISRNLKKILGDKVFDLTQQSNKIRGSSKIKGENKLYENNIQDSEIDKDREELPSKETFFEIVPLNENFEDSNQKDLSSVSIDDLNFPSIVYMIVDKKIELKIKTLKEFPQWHFLSKDELERKTIQIFNDLKTAKTECSRENKVIKIPNTNVFKIVSKILTSRGISRIIYDDLLISL
tara:strand:- start:224 stop:862 length:639 start_codon:yes stop_codon:yes gene_type:complete